MKTQSFATRSIKVLIELTRIEMPVAALFAFIVPCIN